MAFAYDNEIRATMVSSTNYTDTELAAFINTVINVENNRPPTSERISRSDVPSSTDRGPNNTQMEQANDAESCMVLERVYYSSEEDRILQQGFQLSEVTSIESLESSRWFGIETMPSRMIASCKQRIPYLSENKDTSTQAEHFRTHEAPFLHPICEQPSTDSNYFLPRKSTSMETMNLKQQSSIMYNSVKGQLNYELNGAQNASCYLDDEQANVFETHNGYKSGEVFWNSGVNSAAYGQVKEKRTPPFCFPESRTYYPRNGGSFISDQICKYDPRNDNQLQKGVERTIMDIPNEVWKQKVHNANKRSLSEIWQPNHFAVNQNGNEFQSQSTYNLSGSMQMASTKPVPCFQAHPSNTNRFKDQRYATMLTRKTSSYDDARTAMRHETDDSIKKMVMDERSPEGCHTKITRRTDEELQNLMHPVVGQHDEHYDLRQAFGEESQICKNISRGVKRVLPKRHFAFGGNRCATVKGTRDTSILLREPHHDKSQIKHSRPVLENNEEGESLTRVVHCSVENGGTSQERNSGLDESPTSYLLENEKANKAPIMVSNVAREYYSECKKRSSEKEITSHLQPSQDAMSIPKSFKISQNYAIPSTVPSSELPNHEAKEKQALSSKQNAYKCDFQGCSKAYHKSSQRLHTGERSFRCPWKNCTRTFSRSHERSRHFKQHSSTVGLKSFQCSYCSRYFSRSDTWKLHLKTKHMCNIKVLPACFTM